MKELSVKQRRIFEYIQSFIDKHDYPPSIRQIQEACDISSTSVVDYNLRILERLGYIRRDREVSRAIELLVGVAQGGIGDLHAHELRPRLPGGQDAAAPPQIPSRRCGAAD